MVSDAKIVSTLSILQIICLIVYAAAYQAQILARRKMAACIMCTLFICSVLLHVIRLSHSRFLDNFKNKTHTSHILVYYTPYNISFIYDHTKVWIG